MIKTWGAGLVCALCLVECTTTPVPVTYDGVPHVGGGVNIDTDDYRQGETSMGVARISTTTNIVTAFNDSP
jgi:hypothetical protein